MSESNNVYDRHVQRRVSCMLANSDAISLNKKTSSLSNPDTIFLSRSVCTVTKARHKRESKITKQETRNKTVYHIRGLSSASLRNKKKTLLDSRIMF